MKVFAVIFLFLISQVNILSQDISNLFKERGEIQFEFFFFDKADLKSISNVISIDKVDLQNNSAIAYANQQEFEIFLKYDFNYKIIPYSEPKGIVTTNNIKEAMEWDVYPTYETYVQIMQQFAIANPSLCKLYSIGETVEGREILFVKISDNVNEKEAEPQFMYTSTMHGDETTGYVLMLHLIDYLLTNYRSNAEVRNLVNNLEIWINPLANPDGTYAGGNSSVSGATRYNANWVDLNRHFKDWVNGPHPDGRPTYEPEAMAMMELADSNNFTMSANFHGGTEVINYPWDVYDSGDLVHPDDAWFQYVSHEYADTAQAYSPSNYMTGFNDGITNGGDWYVISGGRQDYMNYYHHCREVTMEISDIKLVSESELLPHWEYNYRSFLNYMQQSLNGIQGVVYDSLTGEPIEAKITILTHDNYGSEVYSNSKGRFARPIYAGTYNVKVEADSFFSKNIYGVQVVNGEATELNVGLISTLTDIENDVENTVGEFKLYQNYPNPISVKGSSTSTNLSTKIRFSLPNIKSNYNCKLEVFNSLGQKIKTLIDGNISSGTHEVEFSISNNSSNLPSGIYFYQLKTENYISTKKMILLD